MSALVEAAATLLKSEPVFKNVIAIDFETFLWETGNLAPRIVCGSFASRPERASPIERVLYGNADAELKDMVFAAWSDDTLEIVGQHFHFDTGCQVAMWPDLMPLVWAKLEKGLVHDTEIREKLLNLATVGKIRNLEDEDGVFRRTGYGLDDLILQYEGLDRKDSKKAEDSWRKHYFLLDGQSAKDYPPEAQEYPLDDASDTLLVYEGQEDKNAVLIAERGIDAFTTEPFQVAVAFALQLMTCWGWKIDPVKKREIEEMLSRVLSPERHKPLYDAGLLTPARPAEPYKNGATNADGTPKLKAPIPEKAKRAPLIALVEQVCRENGIEIKKNDATEHAKEVGGDDIDGSTKTGSDVLDELAPFHPLLQLYKERQTVMKLLSTELPRMESPIGIVHPVFDVLKETGRTSSYADKSYASAGIQNVDPRAKPCYIPRPGNVLLSADYKQLEFVSMGQKCYDLFGHSVMRDKINAGVDVHTFLGGQIAFRLNQEFRESCDSVGVADPEGIFQAFDLCRSSDEESIKKFFAKFRKLAKPVGFGFPGGLGAQTFISFARANPYNIVVTLDEAKILKEVFFGTYTEMPEYSGWISNSCPDPWNGKDTYAYTSPFGMHRAGASYCAAMNGAMLQTPAAEGAKLATFEVVRACYDPSLGSCLFGCRPLAFIHDELILEIPNDEFMHERACEVVRIMVSSMRCIMKDMNVQASACLMPFWTKDAEPRFDSNNRLKLWTPSAA